MSEPDVYEAWYDTSRGAWIAGREFDLLKRLLQPAAGDTVLDAGTGTGHFARLLATAGLQVTGLDPDAGAVALARGLGGGVVYLRGDVQALPFPDRSFDHCTAITSLCFVPDPEQATAELWRVSRRGVFLGLLNRHSLLYRQRAGRGGYRSARWDDATAVRRWAQALEGEGSVRLASAVFLPAGGLFSRVVETLLPVGLPWGGFLAVYLRKRMAVAGSEG